MKRKAKQGSLRGEFNYASHHHLIPLYVVCGLIVLALLVLGSFLSILWQNSQQDALRPSANMVIQAHNASYLTAVIAPAEKKQYVYSANVRFPAADPYDTLRYSFDPGMAGTKTSSTVTLSTDKTIQGLQAPVANNPAKSADYIARLQQCSRLYVIRFEPGLTPYGGFVPLKEIKLKDARTAYIHKNTLCVPTSTVAMNQLDEVEKVVLSVESF